ncbi:hypothetical protein NY78_0261 [Desulfovibrio sp. TomC]|nr:hypothetical protein NY78_0261 [Desulfovibrio sp. TomC]
MGVEAAGPAAMLRVPGSILRSGQQAGLGRSGCLARTLTPVMEPA